MGEPCKNMKIQGIRFSYTNKYMIKECVIGELEDGTPITVWRESNYNNSNYQAAYYKSIITPYWWNNSNYNKGTRCVEKGIFDIYPSEEDFVEVLSSLIEQNIINEDPTRDINLYI